MAQRQIKPKRYGAEVGYFPDPFRKRYVAFESSLEEKLALHWASLPSTRDLREQQKAGFRKGGRVRHHWFDYVVTRHDGRRIAYAVKYARDVDDDLIGVLEAVAAHEGDDFADEYRIACETDIDEVRIANARLICRYAGSFDLEAIDVVRPLLPRVEDGSTFGSIADRSGMGERGFRAAVVLVQSGLVRPPKGVPIDESTPALPGSTMM